MFNHLTPALWARTRPVKRRSRKWASPGIAIGIVALGALAPFGVPVSASPGLSADHVSEHHNFDYSGKYDSVRVPAWASKAVVTVVGGSGGSTCVPGGAGTKIVSTIDVTENQVLWVGVGGRGGTVVGSGGANHSAPAGWGANEMVGGIATASNRIGTVASGGGGSAFWIGFGGEELIVAGGGGGAGMCHEGAGGIGGANSDGGKGNDVALANGGHPGAFAAGPGRSTGHATNAGGGGGGYFAGGGGGEGDDHFFVRAGGGGGGAGSSYVSTRVPNRIVSTDPGRSGNGYVTVTFEGGTAPSRPIPTDPPEESATVTSPR